MLLLVGAKNLNAALRSAQYSKDDVVGSNPCPPSSTLPRLYALSLPLPVSPPFSFSVSVNRDALDSFVFLMGRGRANECSCDGTAYRARCGRAAHPLKFLLTHTLNFRFFRLDSRWRDVGPRTGRTLSGIGRNEAENKSSIRARSRAD